MKLPLILVLAPALCVAMHPLLMPAEEAARVEPGKPAPAFTLRDQDGKDVSLAGLKGKKHVLVAFYPKDFTSGCTSELKGLGAEHDVFVKAGVQVLGVSVDPVASHKKFCDELKLPFTLLSDEGGKVAKLYGVLQAKPEGAPLAGRSVFLVDKDGLVRYADDRYDLKTADDHDALLKAIAALDGKKGEAKKAAAPKLEDLKFGSVKVNGRLYDTDVVIAKGVVRERDKGPSKGLKGASGHTPLSAREAIPWDCKVLIIGIGMDSSLPVLDDVKTEAKKRGVELILKPTPEAVEYIREHWSDDTNAILHVTC